MGMIGKSFLKKESASQNSRNFGFRYSAVDMEHLWNETQGLKYNEGENIIRIAKGNNNEIKKGKIQSRQKKVFNR